MIIKVIKKILFAFLAIYSIDLLLKGFNIFVPINFYTIITVMILGFPGLIMISLAFFFLL